MTSTMKCLMVILGALALTTTGSPVGEHRDAAQWEALKAVSESNLDFTKSLFKVISKKPGNLFFSPTSIHVILAMTSLGARGDTEHEMVQGLHLPSDHQTVKDGFRSLMSSLQSNHSVTTKIANKIFTDATLTPKAEFVEAASHDFHSGSEAVDFRHKAEEARTHINSWVMGHTEDKIKDLLPPGSVGDSTTMVLVNALYFKGSWANSFEKHMTSEQPFYVSADVTKTVPMMSKISMGGFPYTDSEALNAQILELPYKGKDVSMMIILPKEKHGLRDVETRLSQMSFNDLMSREVTYPTVELFLPKFKLEHPEDLTTILSELGMSKMFNAGADFSGLLEGDRDVHVSKVLHKAFIDVDEDGTEAAAATAVLVRFSSVSRDPTPEVHYKVDHPFLFMIVKKEHHQHHDLQEAKTHVLFMGRCADLG